MTAPVTRPHYKTGPKVGSNCYATALVEGVGADWILAKIAEGEFMQDIAKEIGVGYGTLYEFLARPEIAESYRIAREAKADIYADRALTVALQSDGDTWTDKHGHTRINNEIVQRSRLQSEVYRWHAKCMSPAKYGDKVAVDQNITVSPLAEAFAQIAKSGSSIPISSYVRIASQDVEDVEAIEDAPGALDPCVLCGDDGLEGDGCPLCGVVLR
jgi:hypothetical protein